MIKLIDKEKIIIMHTNKGKTQRQISRELRIDRKTIRRYLRKYEQKKNKLLDNADDKDSCCHSSLGACLILHVLLVKFQNA